MCERRRPEQEKRNHAPVNHLFEFLIVHPHGLRDGLDTPDVGVGSFQDVLQLGELRGGAGGTSERAKGGLGVSVRYAHLQFGSQEHASAKREERMSEMGSTAHLDVGFGGGFRFPFPLGGGGGLVGDKVVLVVVLLLHPTFSRIRQRL
jgi:hypothetical protein